MNDVLNMLLEAPTSQLDPSMVEKLKLLKGKDGDELKTGLHEVLDLCVHGALASGMVIRILDREWRQLGGSPNDPAPWREGL